MDYEALGKEFARKVEEWEKEQNRKRDPIAFEKDLVTLMNEMCGKVMAEAVGKENSARKKKL